MCSPCVLFGLWIDRRFDRVVLSGSLSLHVSLWWTGELSRMDPDPRPSWGLLGLRNRLKVDDVWMKTASSTVQSLSCNTATYWIFSTCSSHPRIKDLRWNHNRNTNQFITPLPHSKIRPFILLFIHLLSQKLYHILYILLTKPSTCILTPRNLFIWTSPCSIFLKTMSNHRCRCLWMQLLCGTYDLPQCISSAHSVLTPRAEASSNADRWYG